MSGHNHGLTRQSFEGAMKQVLANATKVCERKCVRPSREDVVTSYEKACLGKCFDRYHEVYEKNLQSMASALKSKESQSIYDDKF